MEDIHHRLSQSEYFISEISFAGHKLFTAQKDEEEIHDIQFYCDWSPLTLHWGVGLKHSKEWRSPSTLDFNLPEDSVQFDDMATQSPFFQIGPDLSSIQLNIPKALKAKQINFVVKRHDTWFNNSGNDYAVVLGSPSESLIDDIIEVETNGNSWTLMHRFNMCNSILQGFPDTQKMAWVFVWMRYSSLRLLDWQRNFNTKPRELSHSQKEFTYTLTNVIKSKYNSGLVYMLMRNLLSGLGKGGDNGQKIRDDILKILHKHKIKRYGNFYEQWHQKLHNNTTPDDIAICEAVIAFNQSNDIQQYWKILDAEGVSKERLASFERNITVEPFFVPQSVPDFQDYLAVLKSVHQGADLNLSITQAKKVIDAKLAKLLDDILANIKDQNSTRQLQRVLEARRIINQRWRSEDVHKAREMLYLDVALEAYTKKVIEETIHKDRKNSEILERIFILCESIEMVMPNEGLRKAITDLQSFAKLSNDLLLLSASDRINNIMGEISEELLALIDQKAKHLGSAFGVDEFYYDLFAEEVLRGTLLMVLSLKIKKLNKKLRTSPWQIISPSIVSGLLQKVDDLNSHSYQFPSVVIASKVSGNEEVPEGVVGVISLTDLDSLAHISVRARNSKTLLAVCYDEEELNTELLGQNVKVTNTNGIIRFSAWSSNENSSLPENVKIEITRPEPLRALVLTAESYSELNVGAKARNCAILQQSLSVPPSAALPYGTLEYFLSKTDPPGDFPDKILHIEADPDDKNTLITALSIIGMNESNWEHGWNAIKRVWASKYTERVRLGTKKAGISIDDIYMSVLCQPIVPAKYAFVLHTNNPFTNDPNELYGEVVLGLGETLVGAFPGKALSFIVKKDSDSVQVTGYCNKNVSLYNEGFICRSDSNSEDLPGFAGAGLFESYPIYPNTVKVNTYSQEPLVMDERYRNHIAVQLKNVGVNIENQLNGPQDIEGVIDSNDQIHIVQSRPQV